MTFEAWLSGYMATERLPPAFAVDVEAVWGPLAGRLASAAHGPAFVIGVCGPQASGKSTATAVLARLLRDAGLRAAVLSIDDLYLPREDRLALAERVHPLLAVRGPPGTHDVSLAERLFDALARPGEVALPRFDKAADTRKPAAEWDAVAAPVDVILFEGWCVGARPQPPEALATPANDLEASRDPGAVWRRYVNSQLEGPYRALFARLGRLVLLRPPGFEAVLAWRQEQERKLRKRLAREGSGPGRTMSDAEVETFIAHYERLTRWILAEMPARAHEMIALDGARRPLAP